MVTWVIVFKLSPLEIVVHPLVIRDTYLHATFIAVSATSRMLSVWRLLATILVHRQMVPLVLALNTLPQVAIVNPIAILASMSMVRYLAT
jgi:hypothetical protein